MSIANEVKKEMTVAWFSAGVSSAVATKLMLTQTDRHLWIE